MTNKTCVFFIVLIFFSCNKKTIYNDYFLFENKNWHTDSLITFQFQVQDTASKHQVIIKVRHNVDYEFQNLFIFFYNNTTKDTIEILLADKKGKWLGNGFGDVRETEIIINDGKIFNKKEKQKYIFEQAMRYGREKNIENLKNIEAIGISILRNNE